MMLKSSLNCKHDINKYNGNKEVYW